MAMARRRQAVALVSGGKDSCHAIAMASTLDCHVCVLAHVAPAGSLASDFGESDDGGWMFQGAAHRATDAIATCAGRTLLRVQTCGDADEDLRKVLQAAVDRDARINACLCGAVFSDYQRIRVERACAATGLVSLAPLWRLPQSLLVQDMIHQGMKAAIVKVAGAGLAPMLLGMELHASRTQKALKKAHERYGAHVGGEGGEYESLALDCEAFEYGCLEIMEAQVRVDDEIENAHLLRPAGESTRQDVPGDCSPFVKEYRGRHSLVEEGKPALLDVQKVRLTLKVDPDQIPSAAKIVHVERQAPSKTNMDGARKEASCTPSNASSTNTSIGRNNDENLLECSRGSMNTSHSQSVVWTSRRASSRVFAQCRVPASFGIKSGLNLALKDVRAVLRDHGVDLDSAVFVTMYLKDMNDFPIANEVYSAHLPPIDPASRACVQIALPEDVCVALDILAPLVLGMESSSNTLPIESAIDLQGELHPVLKRKVLHVQSVSHWAPCCIGPYAQANALQGILHVAGQLGLDAASMNLVSDNPVEQALLAARHSQSVAVVMKSSVRHCMLSCIVYIAENVKASLEEVRQAVFGAMSCDCVPDVDIEKNPEQLEPDDEEAVIDLCARKTWFPLIKFAVVPALPKGAAVEIQPLCFSPSVIHCAFDARQLSDEEDEEAQPSALPWCNAIQSGSENFGNCSVQWVSARHKLFLGSLSCHGYHSDSGTELAQGLSLLIQQLENVDVLICDVYCLRLYYDHLLFKEDALREVLHLAWLECHPSPFSSFAPVFVPVVGLATERQGGVSFVLDISAFHA